MRGMLLYSRSETEAPMSALWFAPSVRGIFWGPNGIRAGWRLSMCIALSIGFTSALFAGLGRVPPLARLLSASRNQDFLTAPFVIVVDASSFLADVFAALIMSRIERRPFGRYGIPLARAFGKLFWQGAICGFLAVSTVVLAIYALGGFSFGTLALSGFGILRYGALWALTFVVLGLAEEFRFRGYSQFTLTTGIGFWPAALVLSFIFGIRHFVDNPGENWVGALSVFAYGLFCCFGLRRTGNLWFPIGFHAAWDFGQSFFYSVPDSGYRVSGSLLSSTIHGPRWLTGGTVGPEGSLFCFILLGVSFLVLGKLYPSRILANS